MQENIVTSNGKTKKKKRRQFEVIPGSESNHRRGYMNHICDGEDGERHIRKPHSRRLTKRRYIQKRRMELHPEFVGWNALTEAMCFECMKRVKLVGGVAGPYSECGECGELTGVDRLVYKQEEKKICGQLENQAQSSS